MTDIKRDRMRDRKKKKKKATTTTTTTTKKKRNGEANNSIGRWITCSEEIDRQTDYLQHFVVVGLFVALILT